MRIKSNILLILLFLGITIHSFSQAPEYVKPKKLEKKAKAEDYSTDVKDFEKLNAKYVDEDLIHRERGDSTYYFVFNNLNSVTYYYDSKKLAKIKESILEGNDKNTIRLLEKYIARFGPENFSKDNALLWRLAQLYEHNGSNEKAKAAYRLVLKHHPVRNREQVLDFVKVQEEYDDLTELEKDYYVPLDYYYKLVEYRQQIDTLRPPKSVLINMGDEVNQKNAPDYGPSINVSGDMLIFTRKEVDNKFIGANIKYSENLYFSTGSDGYFGAAEELPDPIKSSCNEGSAVVSKDGKTLIFSRCIVNGCQNDCPNCQGSCDLFYSHWDTSSNKWSEPKNFGKHINSVGWDSQPSFSITEDTLFFASNRPGGFGLSDIYYVIRIGQDKWSKPYNMGPVINTRGNEWSPFHNKLHKVFYFSSNGHVLNFDKKRFSNDLYKCNFKLGHWLEPKNLGPLVNEEEDETYFSIDTDNQFLYYAKTEAGVDDKSKTDLYSFPVPMAAQPLANIKLKGQLLDEETGKPYKGIVSIIDVESGIEVAPKFMRPDGTYEFDLIDHNKYLLVIQGDDFFRIEELFELNGDTTITSSATSVSSKKLKFTSIEFENGKADILTEMEPDLLNIMNFMVDNPEFILTIGGHTDSDGNADSNIKLSQRRADAIKAWIMDRGYIDNERIIPIGFGSTKPIVSPEVTKEDKQINRRVEFQIKRDENYEPEEPWGDEFED